MTAAGRITATRITAGTHILVDVCVSTGQYGTREAGELYLTSTSRTRPGKSSHGTILVATVTGVERKSVAVNGWRQKNGTVIVIHTTQGSVEASPSQTFSLAKDKDIPAKPLPEAEFRTEAGWDAVEEGSAFDASLDAPEGIACAACNAEPGEECNVGCIGQAGAQDALEEERAKYDTLVDHLVDHGHLRSGIHALSPTALIGLHVQAHADELVEQPQADIYSQEHAQDSADALRACTGAVSVTVSTERREADGTLVVESTATSSAPERFQVIGPDSLGQVDVYDTQRVEQVTGPWPAAWSLAALTLKDRLELVRLLQATM